MPTATPVPSAGLTIRAVLLLLTALAAKALPSATAHGTDANPTRQPGRTAAQQLDNMIDKTAEDRLHTNKTRSRLTRD
jgi:hypothetical protein